MTKLNRKTFEKGILERTYTLDAANRVLLRAARRAYLAGDGRRGRRFLDRRLWDQFDTATTPMMVRALVCNLTNITQDSYWRHSDCTPDAAGKYAVRVNIQDFGNPVYNGLSAAAKMVYDHIEQEDREDWFTRYFDRAWNLHGQFGDEVWQDALEIALLESGRAYGAIQESHAQSGKPILPVEETNDTEDSEDDDEGEAPLEDV